MLVWLDYCWLLLLHGSVWMNRVRLWKVFTDAVLNECWLCLQCCRFCCSSVSVEVQESREISRPCRLILESISSHITLKDRGRTRYVTTVRGTILTETDLGSSESDIIRHVTSSRGLFFLLSALPIVFLRVEAKV